MQEDAINVHPCLKLKTNTHSIKHLITAAKENCSNTTLMKLYLGGTMVCKKSDSNKVYMTVSDKIKTKANVQLH